MQISSNPLIPFRSLAFNVNSRLLKKPSYLMIIPLMFFLIGGVLFWYYKQTRPYINSFGMSFVKIQPGTFLMGSLPEEVGRSPMDDETQVEVILTRPFYLQQTEVTQKQWRELMGTNPSYFQGEYLPVERITWIEVQEFIKKLNQKHEGVYRLPTEAEWEYAARADTSTPYFFGSDPTLLNQYGWYKENAQKTTHPVGLKKPNPWGLYDMYGNVFEWVQDWYDEYPMDVITDPKGPFEGASRVNRGGSWVFAAKYCRSAQRYSSPINFAHVGLGFRLLLEIEE